MLLQVKTTLLETPFMGMFAYLTCHPYDNTVRSSDGEGTAQGHTSSVNTNLSMS